MITGHAPSKGGSHATTTFPPGTTSVEFTISGTPVFRRVWFKRSRLIFFFCRMYMYSELSRVPLKCYGATFSKGWLWWSTCQPLLNSKRQMSPQLTNGPTLTGRKGAHPHKLPIMIDTKHFCCSAQTTSRR